MRISDWSSDVCSSDLKGDVLFQQGEEAAHNYVLGWGRVRLDQTPPDGPNVVLRFMGPGDLSGTVAVLRRMTLRATPTAVEDSRLLAWGAVREHDRGTRQPRSRERPVGKERGSPDTYEGTPN